MAICRILQLGDPLLWRQSDPVTTPYDDSTNALITNLDDTLADFRSRTGYGRGIAAPQVGVLRRAIFVRMQPDGFCGPLVNPEIVDRDSREVELWDACFSFPDLMVRVKRSVGITVDYLDADGNRQRLDAEGDLAELLQHEIDHLDGILAVDRAVSPRAFATREQWLRMQQV